MKIKNLDKCSCGFINKKDFNRCPDCHGSLKIKNSKKKGNGHRRKNSGRKNR